MLVFLFIDQELQRLRLGMKTLLAANSEKVSCQKKLDNSSVLFVVSAAVMNQCEVLYWVCRRATIRAVRKV